MELGISVISFCALPKCFFFCLKYSWLPVLFWLQMCYLIIWHLHTLWNDHHHGKSHNHLSPYNVIIIKLLLTTFLMLLTTFLMLYITSGWLIYYITRGLYLSISFTYFSQPPHCTPLHLLVTTNFFFSVSMSMFLFCSVCFIYISHIVTTYSLCLSQTYFT